ncbi:hypothetical protein E1A91_A01G073300v1 [Gossypium mustelinum]|uniref:Receptor-like serine/threonine-protein kinase n=1 Tax=Gossypium mustelinum TaxID=34275 RepID=A0A5D3AFF9_GOSMU|nr:hypothetical protein E1A91_A01G073300v1 [Gossypium mustelinum]
MVLLLCLFFFTTRTLALNTISPGQSIKDGQTLVSASGSFELGFFSPENSKSRYVGIWNSAEEPIARLLDSGNFVVKDPNDSDPENFLWQSFDYPCDTFLPEMKIGINFVTGFDRHISSWKSMEDCAYREFISSDNEMADKSLESSSEEILDLNFSGRVVITFSTTLLSVKSTPRSLMLLTMAIILSEYCLMLLPGLFCPAFNKNPAPGLYSMRIDPWGLPQLVIKKGPNITSRGGSWNGRYITGRPQPTVNPVYLYEFFWNKNEAYYKYEMRNSSIFSRYLLNPVGLTQRSIWNERKNEWEVDSTSQADQCSIYDYCGSYATCSTNEFPPCKCLEGFMQGSASPGDLSSVDWSNGCTRRRPLTCDDTSKSWADISVDLKECEKLCLRNCSCTAYANLDIREGGHGCLLWFLDLIDITEFSKGGQDLYIRLATSDLEHIQSKGKLKEKQKATIIAISVIITCGMMILALWLYEDLELPVFDFAIIATATNNFSSNNILGQGGFGPVYKVYKLIIHRDLKASNILLDNNMKPKISDFGLARKFGVDQTQAKTRRVVGTYGYMSPEYALDGIFSTKSDVFSFGVLVLEILSGKKNRGFSRPEHDHNLLGHAWTLWIGKRPLELIDTALSDLYNATEVLRCINVALLCVQQSPLDRPNMSLVLLMLCGDSVLPQPKQPGFFIERNLPMTDSISEINEMFSIYESTITSLEPR